MPTGLDHLRAYNLGLNAFDNGFKFSTNPYGGEELGWTWAHGYIDGMFAAFHRLEEEVDNLKEV